MTQPLIPQPLIPLDHGRPLPKRDRTATKPEALGLPIRSHPQRWRRTRHVVGVLAIVAGTLAAVALSRGRAELLQASLFAVSLVFVLSPKRAFRKRVTVGALDSFVSAVAGCAIAAMLSVSVGAIDGAAHPDSLALRLWLFTSVLLCCAGAALGLVERRARARGFLMVPTLVVGAGVVGTRVVRRLADHPSFGLRPIGFLEDGPLLEPYDAELDLPVLGGPADAVEVAAKTGARHVIFAFTWEKDYEMAEIARRCQDAGLVVTTIPRLFESINGLVTLDHIGGLPLMTLRPVSSHGWRWTTKYAIDRLLATSALFVLSPLILAIALAVRINSSGPVIYRQRRVGRNGRQFDLLKFRSMLVDAPAPNFLPGTGLAPGGIEGADRRTSMGGWLRNTSLDELPQLWNVARGEMSLVGPRPERPEFVARFSREIARYDDRHRVKPGITGWAQVNGLRGQTSIEDRVEWDNHYIENWSLMMEVRTLLATIGAVLFFREQVRSPADTSDRGPAVPIGPDLAHLDAAGAVDDAFLVVGPRLTLQAMSPKAEQILGMSGPDTTDLPITDLLVDAGVGREDFVAALTRTAREDGGSSSALVRPRGVFGIRIPARITRGGPARSVLIVLDTPH